MGPLMGVAMMGGPPGGVGGGMGGMRPIMGPMGMDPGFVGNMNAMMQVMYPFDGTVPACCSVPAWGASCLCHSVNFAL